jgi:enterochelin esterase-like enzyme
MPHWNSFDAFLAEANQTTNNEYRQALVDDLLAERHQWPWIEGNKATFIFSNLGVRNVALNLDTIQADPPFAPMTNLAGTTLWYVTHEFDRDSLLDYMLAVDDPMTPLATESDVIGRVARYWRVDPLNPLRMDTPQMNVSVLRMPDARPFPDWSSMRGVPRGRIFEHAVSSTQLGFTDRRLWVYTPPGYEGSGVNYPLLIMHDGQWAIGPLQAPFIADTLIKHGRIQPLVIAMIQSGGQEERLREYVSNDRHYGFLLTELLPFVQTNYRIDSTNLGVTGVAMGAIAAAHAALRNPAVFSTLAMISPPMGKGPMQEQLGQYLSRFEAAELLPKRIFQSVGRYEARARFIRPAQALREIINRHHNTAYKYLEVGSGHGLVGFRSILPEAIGWAMPGKAEV